MINKGVKPERHRISGPEMLFTGTNNSTVQYSLGYTLAAIAVVAVVGFFFFFFFLSVLSTFE